MKNRKLFNILSIILLALFLAASLFFFKENIYRLFWSGKSVVEMVKSLFIDDYPYTSSFQYILDNGSATWLIDFSGDWNAFTANFQLFGKLFINLDNFKLYLANCGRNLSIFVFMIMFIILIVIAFAMYSMIDDTFHKNSKVGDISKPLKASYWLVDKFRKLFHAPKIFFKEFYKSVYFKIMVIFFLAFNLNLASIAIDIINVYFYILFTMDPGQALWELLLSTICTVSPIFKYIHPVILIIICYILFDLWRKSHAIKKLNKFEDKNEKFIDNQGIAVGIYGPVNAGKTLLNVDMSLSSEKMFRDDADKLMHEIYFEFPDFPFRSLEKDVEEKTVDATFKNKFQVQYYFQAYFKDKTVLYNYDLTKQKSKHYDYLKTKTIQDELVDYAQLYYIWISSLALSSFSIRFDGIKKNEGHRSYWDYDFITRNNRNMKDFSYHSKNIDYDMFRLLKQIKENNPNACVLDIGVITLSEIAKERGNANSNRRRKDMDVKPNNDGYGISWKIIRHLGSVRNHCFIRGFWDDQRFGALSGDEALIAETNIYIPIQDRSFKSALFCYWLEPLIMDCALNLSNKAVEHHFIKRSDKSLRLVLVNYIGAFCANYLRNRFNRFSFRKMEVEISQGDIHGGQRANDDNKYFLIPKKCFSNRYLSACYRGLFDEMMENAEEGINQAQPFAGDVANLDEILAQNSFFGNDIVATIQQRINNNKESKEKSKKSKK